MSSAYIEFHIEDISLKNFQKSVCQWSGEPLYLSVVSFSQEAGGTVKLLNKNGLLLETDDQLGSIIPEKPGVHVASTAWHPNINVLAVGWENGDLGCYQISGLRNKWVYASPDPDYATLGSIIHIAWIGHHGNELVTVDSTGLLLIWTFDHMSAQLQSRASHQMNDEITDLVPAFIDGEAGMYLSSSSGVVYQLISHSAHVIDIVQLEQAIKRILFFNKRGRLIVITESLVLHQYASSDEFMEVAKVKLSGANRILGSETVSLKLLDEEEGLIAICVTGERVIRLWQLENGQNAAVIVAESADSHWAGVTTLDYNRGILSAGTSNSHVIIWKRQSTLEFQRSSQVALKGSIISLAINRRGQVAVTTANNDLYLLEEQSMCAISGGGIAVAQVGAKRLRFFWMEAELERSFELDVHLPVRSLYIEPEGKCIAISLTGSKETHFYKIGQSSVVEFKSHQLESNGERMFVMQKFIVYYIQPTIREGKIYLSLVAFDLQTDNQTIEPITLDIPDSFSVTTDESLNVSQLDLNGNHLFVLFTHESRYYYITCEINGTIMKLKTSLTPLMTNGEQIKSARINCTGSLIAICDPYQAFVLQLGESRPFEQASLQIKEPIEIFWASNEGRLFAFKDSYITTIAMCAQTRDDHIAVRHYDQIEVKHDSQLLAFEVPTLFFLESGDFITISNQILSEFKGLSVQTIKIMLDFLTSPGLDLNQMIKTINRLGEDNAKLWTNLARISVKCRDIKMGLYCITKLRNARVANDVKKELYATNNDLCGLAVLAINLQLYSEAEELLKESGDRLALSKFYQNQNEWQKAQDCVDKVNLKTVYYNYAKHLENEEGNIQEAVTFYEKSNTHLFEVPRMLFDKEGTPVLQRYCLGTKTHRDPQLIRWWGQYCESLGDIQQALAAYEKSQDYYHLVRLLCYTGETERAKTVVNSDSVGDSDSRGSRDAGLLYLGRHLESTNPNESISYYLSSGAIKHALRVCRNNGYINELIKITVNHGTKADAKELINKYMDYAEESGVSKETIVQLHHKCGSIPKAIELSIQYRTWTQLREIIREEMNRKVDQHDFEQRPTAVTDQNIELALLALRDDADIIDIVIDMLLLTKNESLTLLENLLVKYNVEINEKLIEKVEKVAARSSGSGNKLAKSLAEMALQQGKYVIAAKLFNSLGDRSSSIKALIRNGQTDKVISYANIARDKAVYKIAANYLQTVGHEDGNIIATFYKKAGAKQELERFLKTES